jgi:hypothetical protein
MARQAFPACRAFCCTSNLSSPCRVGSNRMPIRVSQLQDGDVSAQQLHTEGPDAEGSSPSLEFLSRYADFTPSEPYISGQKLGRDTQGRWLQEHFRQPAGLFVLDLALTCWSQPWGRQYRQGRIQSRQCRGWWCQWRYRRSSLGPSRSRAETKYLVTKVTVGNAALPPSS